ncbi:MAG TPA: hypothetical protein VMF62_15090 [Acetobacteraceae bacterium]|jgi:hypothetical protein|nr:hypothetical protein [Acetobacteraceae bacterium]
MEVDLGGLNKAALALRKDGAVIDGRPSNIKLASAKSMPCRSLFPSRFVSSHSNIVQYLPTYPVTGLDPERTFAFLLEKVRLSPKWKLISHVLAELLSSDAPEVGESG